ncbi:MAG TPA: trypsin-like peptidase domain-containing protein [Streptosporangiaceae bacterium]|nr:trypsin-like peptidase domain-containing protein [Streptosporangiaceae bacterium]
MGNLRQSWRLPAVTLLAGALLGSGVTAGALVAAPAAVVRQIEAAAPAAAPGGTGQSYAPVVKLVAPSVVLIRTADGLGSGVILDDKGNIVTNAHVAGRATTFQIQVGGDRAVRSAHLVGSYADGDLAVIRADDSTGMKPARFGDSGSVRVGDVVLAVGNPLGLASSVTEGIVSATGRTVTEPATGESPGATLPGVIQTSAPINPGNSGGALVNLTGQVIGIPTLAAVSPGSGTQASGIGFAIPSNTARDIASELINSGGVVSSPPQGVTPERFSPMMPARTSPIDTILRTDTDSPRMIMPTAAVPAAPIPVHNA